MTTYAPCGSAGPKCTGSGASEGGTPVHPLIVSTLASLRAMEVHRQSLPMRRCCVEARAALSLAGERNSAAVAPERAVRNPVISHGRRLGTRSAGTVELRRLGAFDP